MDNKQKLRWQLERERFCIDEIEPPKPQRPEKLIAELIPEILKEEQKKTPAVPEILIDRWPIIVGEQIALHTAPALLTNNVLYIYTDHSGWLAEVKRIPKTALLKKINAVPECTLIRDIRFTLNQEAFSAK